MPFVKISGESHKAMKQYLVDIDGVNLGELVEAAFQYSMENLPEFEEFLGLDDAEQDEEKEETDEEEETEEEPES